MPAVTWPTTVTPVIHSGLKPVFVDANLKDFSFDYEQLDRKITPRTRGIFVAHLLGFPADMAAAPVARQRDLTLLEDCCESQGAKVEGEKVGNLGLAGTFSLYWGHHMTTVEGGMICTNSQELFHLLLLKRSHGLGENCPLNTTGIAAQYPDIDFKFLFLTDGTNFRIPSLMPSSACASSRGSMISSAGAITISAASWSFAAVIPRPPRAGRRRGVVIRVGIPFP